MNKQSQSAVIGAGFGGLALAIRLQASGYQTMLSEERDKPGGCAYIYDVEGYHRFNYSRVGFVEGYLKLGHIPSLNFQSMIRVAPQLMKLQAYRSIYGMVSRFIRRASAKGILLSPPAGGRQPFSSFVHLHSDSRLGAGMECLVCSRWHRGTD